ncbi:MAG: N-acetylmuramoyl-L-alanine amidase [Anaerotignum sp.]|nr:N-acetylmuramoyl-L-alanine amidase [Anaerotignum sp.]
MSKIVIDAGHGKNAAGKRALKSLDPNETREWVLNARVAEALEIYLLSAGHAVLRADDTSGNTDVSLATRVKMANDWKADYYVSIHHNAGINGGHWRRHNRFCISRNNRTNEKGTGSDL